jgi:hypothetical protein
MAVHAGRGAVDTGLGKDVDAILEKSPTLTRDLQSLRDNGWSLDFLGLRLTRDGRRGECRRGNAGRISIDPHAPAPSVVATIAHEVGHAKYQLEPVVAANGLTREEYVTANLMRHLRDEAEAVLYNYQIREEIKRNGGPEIRLSGPRRAGDIIAARQGEGRQALRDAIAREYTDRSRPSAMVDFYMNCYRPPYERAYDRLPEGEKTAERTAAGPHHLRSFVGKVAEQMHALGIAMASQGELRDAAIGKATALEAEKAALAAEIAPSAEMKLLLAGSPALFKTIARTATGQTDDTMQGALAPVASQAALAAGMGEARRLLAEAPAPARGRERDGDATSRQEQAALRSLNPARLAALRGRSRE